MRFFLEPSKSFKRFILTTLNFTMANRPRRQKSAKMEKLHVFEMFSSEKSQILGAKNLLNARIMRYYSEQ